MKNCPNCAASYDPALNKCPYCGTIYFDMSCIDFTETVPIYLKLRLNSCDGKAFTITQKCLPKFSSIEMYTDHTDITDGRDNIISTIRTKNYCTTNIEFISLVDTDGSLYKLYAEGDC